MHRFGILAWLLYVFCSFHLGVEARPPPKTRPPPVIIKPQPPGEVLFEDSDYNAGSYGQYVTQRFKSANITAPRLNMMKPFTNCDDGSYLFFAPRGEEVSDTTATIYDHNGNLIWKLPDGEYREIYNFQMQEYKGQPHILFWSGDNSGGHGDGFYYMYDQHYNLVRKINAGHGLSADLHSLIILPEGNALLTSYMKVPADLSRLYTHTRPPKNNATTYMWDCLFQEIDLDDGTVLFQWRASKYFDITESYADHSIATEKIPWDFFHINSVEKDASGNYLVSARHMRCVAYIDGKSGDVLWQLGGKKNSFRDLSSSEATRFVGQHDAHFDGDGKYITLFDNRADWYFEQEHVSKGKRIEIDTTEMTAKIDTIYVHPEKIFTFSQGSYQTLPNGNVLLGYGFTGAMTEFDRNGTVLCDAYFQPKSRFSSGDVQSYRNLKFNWTGLPDTKPSAVIEDGIIYVSWLGSTEVHGWWLQDSTTAKGRRWAAASIFGKTGFETQIPVRDLVLRQYVRLVALDADEQPLGTSPVISIGDLATEWEPVSAAEAVRDAAELERRWQDLGALVGFVILIAGCAALIFFGFFRPRLAKKLCVIKEHADHSAAEKTARTARFWHRLRSMWPSRHAWVSYHVLPMEEDFRSNRSSELDDR